MLLPGCPGRRTRLAYDQRVAHLFTDVELPATDSYQAGMAVRPDAVEGALLRRYSVDEGGPLPAEFTLAGVPGLAGVAIQLDWTQLVLEIRPSSNGSPSSIDVLAAVPGVVQASAGLLAMEQDLRLTARLAVELEARVPEDGGLELVGTPDAGAARLSVALPGFPPGLSTAISSTAELEFRRLLKEAADGDGAMALFKVPGDGALGPLPLSGAVVRTFPAGRETLFIGFQTRLPVTAPPTVSALHLDPGDEDWVLRIDEQPLALALARTGLSGKLGAGLQRSSRQLDVQSLTLSETGFVAGVRLWKTAPPMSAIHVDVSGAVSLHDGKFILGVHTLEVDGRTQVGKRRLPWIMEFDIPQLPVTLESLHMLDGGLEIGGRL